MQETLDEGHSDEDSRPRRQVPARTRLAWALGGVSSGIASNFVALANLIYINALHYNPNLVNIAKSLPTFASFVTGPMIGHLSDNTRSRWGRRKPWMLAGLLVIIASGFLFWVLPSSDGSWNWPAFFFISALILISGNIGGGFYGTALGAMGYEMSTDYNERTQLFKWAAYIGTIAGFLGPWFFPMCLWFEGAERSQVARGSEGVIYVCMIMTGLILLTGLPPILFCRERVEDHKGEKKVSFLKAVRMTLHNKPFWLLVVSNLVMRFAMNITGFFFFFLTIYYVGKGNQELGGTTRAIFYNTITAACLLGTAPIAALCDRIGKKATLLLTLAMSAVAYASLALTFTQADGAYLSLHLPWSAAGKAITFQWPCLISGFLIGAFTNTMPMIKSSMLADICDYDELKFGHRREAFYGSVFGVAENMTMAISLALQGAVLVASGFDSNLPQQTDATMRFWLLAVVITQPLGFLIGIASILFYPLSRARMHAIRAEIDARKQKAGATAASA